MDKREAIITHLKDFFKKSSCKYGLEIVFLYGSWACGLPRHSSDVDIGVVFSSEPSSDDESFERITDISHTLSAEFNMEVNVIRIHEDFRKPMLYYNAIVAGLPVYINDHDRYTRLKNEAVYQMEDYSIFGIDWQHGVTRKNLEVLKYA